MLTRLLRNRAARRPTKLRRTWEARLCLHFPVLYSSNLRDMWFICLRFSMFDCDTNGKGYNY